MTPHTIMNNHDGLLSRPDVEGDGHHGVEDDDVTPEGEETSVEGVLVLPVVQVPGHRAHVLVPEAVADGQAQSHQDQQRKDLERPGRDVRTHYWGILRSWMVTRGCRSAAEVQACSGVKQRL